MTFKWGRPVKLPRLTTPQFQKQRADYVAKHGYTVHIPGFEDVIKWDITREPNELELIQYRAKDVKALGEKRFAEIKDIMQKKREKFLRLLGSPRPDVLMNASSILTALDDINDALGTLAVIARIIARRLPATASKFIEGPAGWVLLASDIAGLALQLSGLPFKAKRLQHELNDVVKGHPLSKKARLRRLRKLRRLNLTKGEIIEALQVSENVCGIGISLGPIFGMLWDIPAGLVREAQGKKVTVTGIKNVPETFDHPWARLMKTFWTGILSLGKDHDEDISKGLVATQMSTQAAQSYLEDTSPLDAISPLQNLRIPAPKPYLPSTKQIVLDELGHPESHTGWVPDGKQEIDPRDPIEIHLDALQEELANWRDRNKRDTTAMVAAQNEVETGPAILEMLEGEGSMEMDYDPGTMAMLSLMNQNLRLPEGATQEQAECFWNMAEDYYWKYGHITPEKAQLMARGICGFDFTTQVPETAVPEEYKAKPRQKGIHRLQEWYTFRMYSELVFMVRLYKEHNIHAWTIRRDQLYIPKVKWLERYGFPYVRYSDWWAILTPAEKAATEYPPILPEFYEDPTILSFWFPGVPMFPGDPPKSMIKWKK